MFTIPSFGTGQTDVSPLCFEKHMKLEEKMKIRFMAALFAGILLTGFVAGCNSTPAATPDGGASGTATGVAPGHGGDVSVTITMENGKITAVELDLSSETPAMAGQVASRAPQDMINFNDPNIDNVAGSTVTSSAVREAAKSAVEQIKAAASSAPAPAPVVEETTEVVE